MSDEHQREYMEHLLDTQPFRNEYMLEPFDSPEWGALLDMVDDYRERTEAFDREVCTGRRPDGIAIPVTGEERRLINEHSLMLRASVERRASRLGLSPAEVRAAFHHRPWSGRKRD